METPQLPAAAIAILVVAFGVRGDWSSASSVRVKRPGVCTCRLLPFNVMCEAGCAVKLTKPKPPPKSTGCDNAEVTPVRAPVITAETRGTLNNVTRAVARAFCAPPAIVIVRRCGSAPAKFATNPPSAARLTPAGGARTDNADVCLPAYNKVNNAPRS